jgi:hypothetical protein
LNLESSVQRVPMTRVYPPYFYYFP